MRPFPWRAGPWGAPPGWQPNQPPPGSFHPCAGASASSASEPATDGCAAFLARQPPIQSRPRHQTYCEKFTGFSASLREHPPAKWKPRRSIPVHQPSEPDARQSARPRSAPSGAGRTREAPPAKSGSVSARAAPAVSYEADEGLSIPLALAPPAAVSYEAERDARVEAQRLRSLRAAANALETDGASPDYVALTERYARAFSRSASSKSDSGSSKASSNVSSKASFP